MSKLQTSGAEKGRGVIFAANHSSELDAIVVPAALPFLSPLLPIFYVSRPRAFYKTSGWRQIFYGGLLFKLWGSHHATAGFKDYEKSLATHINILEKGGSVLIFPEGRKTRDGNIGKEAHGGVAYLAYRTGCSVVPVRIFGDFNMTLGDFLLLRRHIVAVFGTPIVLPENDQKKYQKEAGIILSAIAALHPKK
ncbi:MAG: L-acyl-sn-glycerol-3-phosphate acetyltransferase [Parcubacteria group bacterium Gr01-1014_17]|nr:MAG: L-acyl-sn-glycerol-3-phosphate acetyltransferase [Parcubacteria group bacterium Gr01-1014_17]